jgi:hypothetical protein
MTDQQQTPAPAPVTPPAPAPVTTALSQLTGVARTSFADASAARADSLPNYKAKKDVIDRIALLDTDILLVGRYHYHKNPEGSATPGLGYVLCHSQFQRQGEFWTCVKQARCCELLGESRIRCVTPIIKYVTDRLGSVVKPFDYSLMAWVFNPATMDVLQALAADFPLGGIDLKVACTDEQYQKITITPVPTRVVADPQVQQRFGQSINDWIAAVTPKLGRLIGRDVPEAEMLAKIGAGAPAVGAAPGAPSSRVPMPPPEDIASLFD